MSNGLGLYIHVPFCLSKCSYCHFASGVFSGSLVRPYFGALRREMEAQARLLQRMNANGNGVSDRVIDTIFVGGGTPSLVDGQEIVKTLEWIRNTFSLAAFPEITLEVNPGTVTEDKLDCYREAGVNRISLGVQTFQDHLLKKVGRSHSVVDSISTVEMCRRKGIDNLSVDLIAGLPDQTGDDWQENLIRVVALSPEHLSLYLLEIHEDAHLGKREGLAGASLPDEEAVADWYQESVERLGSAGWKQYEISNFCKPGRQSRHNLKYWTDQPFIGFGCGAHSYWAGERWGNERDPVRYVELLEGGKPATTFRSEITPRQHLEEVIFLGLRLNAGLDLWRCRRKFGFDLRERFGRELSQLAQGELIEIKGDRLRLTARGRLFSNEVFVQFMQ
ncbi:MAG: radical SAM family heme chaperone HemW [Acidobacteriota bacterium]|nr:radical SAM family heme chaperone HemW [Acidobacteriota bacterium]